MTMQGFNFTERTRRILGIAREEAVRLGHQYVGTEHILLGLLLEGEGVACTVLENLSMDAESIRERIVAAVKIGKTTETEGPDLPYTSRAKKVLELAMSEAHELSHSYVGSEHLLLGLLREEKGIAAQVLVAAGVTLDAARRETVRLLGKGRTDGAIAEPLSAAPRATARPRLDTAPRSLVIELQHEGGWILRRELGTIDEAIRFLSTYTNA